MYGLTDITFFLSFFSFFLGGGDFVHLLIFLAMIFRKTVLLPEAQPLQAAETSCFAKQ